MHRNARRRRPDARGGGDRDRAGCLGVLLAPPAFILGLARDIHESRHRERPGAALDPAITRVQTARTLLGIAATLWLLYAYPLREGAGAVLEDKLVEALVSALVLVGIAPLALTAFVLAARPHLRLVYRRRLRGPLTSLGALFAGVLLYGFGPVLFEQFDGGAGLLVGLAGSVLLLAGGLFTLASAVLAVHHAFRTAEVHDVLPPLLSPVLVWVMCVVQLLDSPPVTAPLWVRVTFLLGPPLSVTALSAWELRRLQTRHGLTLRGALGRTPAVAR
ncbi:hypothetical protein C6N75_08175 [Streptomyces solincola]|uniref:Uncharacterized protein n=1 Tax=Streptomyces solincola TaxID=2100817 RepID=A0A2S9PZ94_9ACTN|nr:hypothetical protein [Streptomyces solincola]PRH79712.1 hypothetical protein C6N75_08175 [Streptomyces solincola]